MAKKIKILAADKMAAEGIAYIEAQTDVELTSMPGLGEDELAKIVGEHDGMIVRSGVQVTAKVLENPGRLKAIVRAGVGVDNIDLEAATSQGILVMNSAEASTISTAEHAFTLLMAIARNIGAAHASMQQGKWDRGKFTGRQLSGKTLGVVGFGRIGQTVAERALAFGMSVVAYDPFINAKTMMDGKAKMFTSFEDILPHADILTFHVPLNNDTRGMLGEKTFGKCRKGVLIVNASRGGVVDEDALLVALESGQCGGAALDVYATEPPAADHPLRRHPRVVLTPHLGASTVEGQEAVSVSATDSLLAFLRGEGIRGAVNAPGLRVDLDPLQACFVDLAYRMSQLINPMITRGFATIDIELSGDNLAAAAATIERMSLIGLLKGHLDVQLNMINVRQVAEQRGINVRLVTSEKARGASQLKIEVRGPKGATGDAVHPGDKTRKIVGRVYDDMRPRVVEINGYHMDMIPDGVMVLIQNDDRPGMVGTVGNEFGAAQINIADMAISRRDKTALMLLKVDEEPSEELFNALRGRDGILKVAMVKLPTLA
jgi:D-3-phosphoglycerate dehydrogenase